VNESPSTGANPRSRIIEICLSLPEVTSSGDQHIGFQVRGRRFAWYLEDHHGDERIALTCKAEPGENTSIIAASPGRYFFPSYVGSRGWIGYWLDQANVDWEEVTDLILDSYILMAPKHLVAETLRQPR
jgi:phosphoribosylglycinamide formyltransferase-1